MTGPPFSQPSITISLPEQLRLELEEMARNAKTSESELVQRAVERLVQANRDVGIPRFARRLGPMVLLEPR